MTTVEINLPADLAQDAAQAGLLSSSAVEAWLRERLAHLELRRAVAVGLDAAERGEITHIDSDAIGGTIRALGQRAQARADAPR